MLIEYSLLFLKVLFLECKHLVLLESKEPLLHLSFHVCLLALVVQLYVLEGSGLLLNNVLPGFG